MSIRVVPDQHDGNSKLGLEGKEPNSEKTPVPEKGAKSPDAGDAKLKGSFFVSMTSSRITSAISVYVD